jgi:Ca-activated chloride channel family protein
MSSEIVSLQTPYDDARIRFEGGTGSVEAVSRGDRTDDLLLLIGTSRRDVGFGLVSYDPDGAGGEDGYFMATFAPARQTGGLEVQPKNVTFVVDRSGSMAGVKMTQARDALRRCIEALSSGDSFNVVSFSTSVATLFGTPREATPDNIEAALDFVAGIEAGGDTNIGEALRAALRQSPDRRRANSIVFATDGIPTAGETNIDGLIRSTADALSDSSARLFAFGLGYDVNTRLIDNLAKVGRGESGYVRPNEDISDRIGGFFAKVGAPVLTNLEIDWGRGISEVYPRELPDLYRDQQLVVFGRYDSAKSTSVTLRGRSGRDDIELSFGAEFGTSERSREGSFVGNLWANRKVAELLDQIRDRGERAELREQVVALGTRWNIVTPYTSYLITEDSTRETPRRIDPPRSRNPQADVAEPPPQSTGAWQLDALAGDAARGLRAGPLSPGAVGGAPGGFSGAQPSTRARQSAAAPRAEVGRDAVEESLRRSEQRNGLRAGAGRDESNRVAAGRTFDSIGGVWVERGVSGSTVTRRITALSPEYFELLRRHPDLGEVLSLGDRVRFMLGREVVEISP